MAYSPPPGDAVQLVFASAAYSPPAGSVVVLVFDDGGAAGFPSRYFMADAVFF